mmetsp:Transcript_26401/g.83688  ORF Transcript_26401/g.83688 Transcript_26401/m.83688 type:complete len:276 (-) Transcript_26401:641-1468(-)
MSQSCPRCRHGPGIWRLALCPTCLHHGRRGTNAGGWPISLVVVCEEQLHELDDPLVYLESRHRVKCLGRRDEVGREDDHHRLGSHPVLGLILTDVGDKLEQPIYSPPIHLGELLQCGGALCAGGELAVDHGRYAAQQDGGGKLTEPDLDQLGGRLEVGDVRHLIGFGERARRLERRGGRRDAEDSLPLKALAIQQQLAQLLQHLRDSLGRQLGRVVEGLAKARGGVSLHWLALVAEPAALALAIRARPRRRPEARLELLRQLLRRASARYARGPP